MIAGVLRPVNQRSNVGGVEVATPDGVSAAVCDFLFNLEEAVYGAVQDSARRIEMEDLFS